MWTLALMLTTLAPQAAPAAAAPLPPDQQVAAAVLAAPAERRADATVLGYDASGALVTLRKGAGDLICLADGPNDADFDVACYQKDLEPFMARGRELHAKGVADKERNQIRWKEVDAGTLTMPREPRALYTLTGTSYDATTNTWGQGAFNQDDITRAAVVYLRHWKLTQSTTSRQRACRRARAGASSMPLNNCRPILRSS